MQKVLTWCIIHNIKKHYETLDNFKKTYSLIKNGKASNDEQIHFCRRFVFDNKLVIRKILGYKDGKLTRLTDVKPFFDNWFHYQPHFNKNYSSGKTYSVHSYWYIDFDVIERYMDDADVADCKSRFYTKEQHHLINRLFLKQKTKIKYSESLKDKNSDIVEEPAKLYDNPDDIDWQNEVPEDEKERDAWINEHCSEACKQLLKKEFEAEIEKNMLNQDFDYGKEAEKVKKLLADAELIECANANSNDDID